MPTSTRLIQKRVGAYCIRPRFREFAKNIGKDDPVRPQKEKRMNKPKSGGNRLNRINEELKREISNIINYEVTNSNVTGMVSVTSVKISPDLRYAKVFLSILNSRNTKQTLAALKSSSGFIRSRIAAKINLRVTPELVFELDESMQYGEKIDTILKDIMKDIKPENQD